MSVWRAHSRMCGPFCASASHVGPRAFPSPIIYTQYNMYISSRGKSRSFDDRSPIVPLPLADHGAADVPRKMQFATLYTDARSYFMCILYEHTSKKSQVTHCLSRTCRTSACRIRHWNLFIFFEGYFTQVVSFDSVMTSLRVRRLDYTSSSAYIYKRLLPWKVTAHSNMMMHVELCTTRCKRKTWRNCIASKLIHWLVEQQY